MINYRSACLVSAIFFAVWASTSLFATSITEVITYASTFPESVGGAQPSALKAELNYDDAVLDAPIAVVMHQFSASSGNFSNYRSNALALRDRGFFVITPGMRGRDGSDGSRDTGAVEIYDIFDAVEAVKEQYPDLVDPDYVYITGYSGGGGNVMSSLTKFPDYWNAGSSFFGISDYGYDATYGWYFHGSGSSHRSIMANDIGNPSGGDPLVLDRYMARASNLASKNNPYAEIHLFVNDDETLTPLYNHQSYYDNALAAAEFAGEFDNITHHIGFPGLYEDFNDDGQNSADELQYWPHQKQNDDQQAAAENWFIDRMAAKQIAPPTLNDSDVLQVPGYLKTQPFALFLGDGEDAAATLNYQLGEGEYTFALAILSSDTSVPTLLQVDASDLAGLMVDIYLDGELVESLAGGDVIETSALAHNSTLTVDFTDRAVPELPILPQPEPLAYWRFESDAGFLVDAGPAGHTLSLGGSTAPSFTALPATPLGEDFPSVIPSTDDDNLGAAELAGTGYFSAGNDAAHQASSFTLEALVSTAGLSSSTQYIASRFTSSGGQRSWSFGITGTGSIPNTSGNGELFFVISSTGSNAEILGSGLTLIPGDDYYVSVSYSPDESVTFRAMNLSAANPTLTTTTVASPFASLHNTTAPLLIGAYNGGSNCWNGLIDEVRLTSGALIESHLLIASGLSHQDWRNHFFTEAEQVDLAIGGSNADPDSDGIENRIEFALGTDPTQPNASPVALTKQGEGLLITFPVVKSPDVDGVLWYAESLLGPWTAVGEGELDTILQSSGFVQTKAYQASLNTSSKQYFFRVDYDVAALPEE